MVHLVFEVRREPVDSPRFESRADRRAEDGSVTTLGGFGVLPVDRVDGSTATLGIVDELVRERQDRLSVVTRVTVFEANHEERSDFLAQQACRVFQCLLE